MKRVKTIFGSLFALTLVSAVGLASAGELDQIKAAGKIRIAVAMGVPLFSYADANLQPAGSDVDTAKLLAKDLGVKLELVQITNAARIPTIQTGKADLAVANLSVTDERKKVIDFSTPYAALQTIVAAPKAVAIHNYADLAGKDVGVTRATVNDSTITKMAKGANIKRFEDDATLITAAVSGQVGVVSTQAPLIGEINKKTSGKPFETKFVMQNYMLGIALPKNNPKLKEWVDAWVVANLKNGKLNEIYKKYHGADLPESVTKVK